MSDALTWHKMKGESGIYVADWPKGTAQVTRSAPFGRPIYVWLYEVFEDGRLMFKGSSHSKRDAQRACGTYLDGRAYGQSTREP